MQIGKIIRQYRKEKNLTQEEVARRLGVTAPAVNKWENGASLPDISFLSPIARLLNISTDTLLSHEKELSDAEANRLVEEALEKFKTEPFDDVFEWGKQRIREYPDSDFLILWMALILESQRQNMGIADEKKYSEFILDCYKHVLESDVEQLKQTGADSLYNYYVQREDYKQAEEYLQYFSAENPERKRKEAIIFSKTGRQNEAYKGFEELIFSGYQRLDMVLNALFVLAMEENDIEKASIYAVKRQDLAKLFEFGRYNEIVPMLELAVHERDEELILYVVKQLLDSVESLADFTKSPLYSHMEFKPVSEKYYNEVRQSILEGFRESDEYLFLRDNENWRDLLGMK